MKHDRPRQPLFESLESRQLFASTGPTPSSLPDLSATLNFTPKAFTLPGSPLTSTSVTITNSGAAMTKATSVPVFLYISRTPTLAPHAVPFKVIHPSLNLGSGSALSVPVTGTNLPKSITAKKFYIIAKVNNGKALHESNPNNNTSTSPALSNPVGWYTGSFTADNGEHGKAILNITANTTAGTSALYAVLDIRTPSTHLPLKHLKFPFNASAGTLTLSNSGSYVDHSRGGRLRYSVSLSASVQGNQLTGPLFFSWHTVTNSVRANATLTATRK